MIKQFKDNFGNKSNNKVMTETTLSKQKKYYEANKDKILKNLKAKRAEKRGNNDVGNNIFVEGNDNKVVSIETEFYTSLTKIKNINRPFLLWCSLIRILNKEFLEDYSAYEKHNQLKDTN